MKETKKGDSPAWARVTGNPGGKGGGEAWWENNNLSNWVKRELSRVSERTSMSDDVRVLQDEIQIQSHFRYFQSVYLKVSNYIDIFSVDASTLQHICKLQQFDP